MIAFTRFRFVLLCLSVIAPVAIAMSCATPPADPEGDDDDVTCAPGQTSCGSYCADISSDPLNCGGCGKGCAMRQICTAGACDCNPPFEACGFSCVNFSTDLMNCGGCNVACPATAPFCTNGTCSATCTLTQCGPQCVNTATDPANCGGCGMACAVGQSCVNNTCMCPAGQMLCNGACATTCAGTGGTGAGGASGTGGAGGAGGSVTTGGAAGSGTSGSGGMGPVMKLCATKVTLAAPTITDFESYDGTKPVYGTDSWTFTMGPTTAPAYAGLYPLSEGTVGEMPPAAYTLTMAAGANASMRAARAANMTTTDWGGGIGLWMGCINASAYTGISFMVRGSGPTGMANISLAMEDATAPDAADPAGGGTCTPAPTDGCAGPTYTFPLTIDWTQITVPWAMFTAGRGAAGAAVVPTGDEITGISFGVNINYVPNPVDGGMPAYVPEPASIEIAVDDLTFTP